MYLNTFKNSTSKTLFVYVDETSIIAVCELKGELESMQYREHKRVAIQGYVAAVQYHTWPPGDQQPGVDAVQETSQSHQRVCIINGMVHAWFKLSF